MKSNWSSLDFSGKRDGNLVKIPPIRTSTVKIPRVLIPLKLTKHTAYVLSQVDIDHTELPFCVAKHYLDRMQTKMVYVHRLNQGARLIGNKSSC